MFSFFSKKVPEQHTDEDIKPSHKTTVVDYDNPKQLAIFFKELTGITFEKQTSILKSKLTSFCKLHHISTFQECLNKTQKDSCLRQELINYLTTNESYFYREIQQIYDLVKNIKDSLHPVNILCAPCSSGEEVYSIVIALNEASVPTSHYQITGIDINSEAISLAQQAIYRERNVSQIPDNLREKYFQKKEEKFHLLSSYKQNVSFKTMNIFSTEFEALEKFDFILSRNMLIYFDSKDKERVQSLLKSKLKNTENDVFYGHADLF